MKPGEQLPTDHIQRLAHIVDQSWLILKSRFLQGRHPILLEAPFQHYFAQILSAYGELCCTERDDLFLVDLESRLPGTVGKRKYLDIDCSFRNELASCAIELKFKKAKQGAQDFGRIDTYQDIGALERACSAGFSFGRFYMITDSTIYVNRSSRGTGTLFPTHDGFRSEAGWTFQNPECAGRQDVKVTLKNSYTFQWEEIGGSYFLELHVDH